MVGFAIFLFHSGRREEMMMKIVYGALALLFQPLIKISFGRELWNVVDVIVAVMLVATIYYLPKQEKP